MQPEHFGIPLDDFLTVPECTVCARGAMAAAFARTADRCAERGIHDTYDLSLMAEDGENGFFPTVFGEDAAAADLFNDVENAFEGWFDYECDEEGPKAEWHRAMEDRGATGLLRAICDNLIANNGFFVITGGAS